MFSERGISAVPIIDENGVVVNLYATIDVITLVRLGAYQSLDLTIAEALDQRSPDFLGVICTASDSIGTPLQLIKKRRVRRLVVVDGEDEERKGGKKARGRLLGIITLYDVLRYVVGPVNIQKFVEPEEPPNDDRRQDLPRRREKLGSREIMEAVDWSRIQS